jgi:hypothetical protein
LLRRQRNLRRHVALLGAGKVRLTELSFAVDMLWLEQWRALAARIEGLLRAAELFTGFQGGRASDARQVVGHSLLPEAIDLHGELSRFNSNFAQVLPAAARAALDHHLAQNWTRGLNIGQVTALAPLAVLRSQFEYAVRDTEEISRSRVELAFEHLRRMIAVDPRQREGWKLAFERGEVACEKLGAVHLLGSGIWAFKVTGSGAATDLVLNEPIQGEIDLVQRTGNAVVLTEWKLVRSPDELMTKAAEARKQASLYAAGILGALELKRTRYIVLVSSSSQHRLGDVESDGVLYRHVVLAVDPVSPSLAARVHDRADAG